MEGQLLHALEELKLRLKLFIVTYQKQTDLHNTRIVARLDLQVLFCPSKVSHTF